jgi:hypothetical protein
MIQQGFESRVKVQQIIDSQLPEFIIDESPKASDFLKQYYISQEYQGGPIDISDNLDQYLKLDNLTPEVVVGFTSLTENISSTSDTIHVSSTKGFPQKYGLLRIDDEIITYTGLTTNTFTGCIRGFSGITNYHQNLNYEELVFSSSDAASHTNSTKVQNLSSLFLQEFYKKIKYSLTPDLQNKDFVPELNVGNFIKEARTLYQSKGTEESFRILFSVLFGETPKIINLEDFLIKPSSANYIRRLVVVSDAIFGNAANLEGQTLTKSTDSNTTASISEVEIIKRKNKIYYKLLLFIGYDDSFEPITGKFDITGSTKNIELVNVGDSTITVDSTIGFPESGILYAGNNTITYTDKSINQFFNCEGITSEIPAASTIFSNETYYGYENGDPNKKVELRITGVLSDYIPIQTNSVPRVGEKIGVKSVGKIIENPTSDKNYQQIFANSWIYNTSSRYEVIDNFVPENTNQITLKSNIDKSSLKIGDTVELLYRNEQQVVNANLIVTDITDKQIKLNSSVNLSVAFNYDIRRRIKNASSSTVDLEFEKITSDIQNVYDGNDSCMYVASNSFPSYQIDKFLYSYKASGVDGLDSTTDLYTKITFDSKVSFLTGSEIYYKPSADSIYGLTEGIYYVEVLPQESYDQIRLYVSKSIVGTQNYLNFSSLTPGDHIFTLSSQQETILSPQKILRKFPLNVNIGDGRSDETPLGSTGMLINGVEIYNYKSKNKIYYGPLKEVNILNGGKNYDVANPPQLSPSYGSALIQPIVSGSIEKIYLNPQDFDIDVVVSIALTGGNGTGSVFQPIFERRRREIEFDARVSSDGGGVDITSEIITFLTDHNLVDGQQIIYRSLGNTPVGIGEFLGSNTYTGLTLKDQSSYYVKFVNNKSIRLHPSIDDFNAGINTIGFTLSTASGIQKFVTEIKNTLSEIKVINGGSGYTNRKLRVLPSGISTANNAIYFPNHGFSDGEIVTYSFAENAISGLSTSNQYYIFKVDDDTFKLSDAGIGATIVTNYQRGKAVDLQSMGSGYHIFNYPDITIEINYSSVGINTDQIKGTVTATPVVRGSIIGAYIYNSGSDYGSSILNYHKKPNIIVKNGKDANCKPIIVNGKITDVSVQFGGSEYYSDPDINVIDSSGSGRGCILKPVIENNKLSDVIIINPGVGYSKNSTVIEVVSSGKNAIFDANVRDLTVNNNVLFNDVNSTNSETYEIITSSYNNLQYFISGYYENLQKEFNDNGDKHSPIIGWAYDGTPIYGSYGYTDPKSSSSAIKRLSSGYSLNPSNITNRPDQFNPGFFIEDYQFTNSGDLDEYNGRFCITNEFPNGVYAYFAPTKTNAENNVVGVFPYFIGNRYRSAFVNENKALQQSFDFNSSHLIRNTFPYKIKDETANNDFIIESNEVLSQLSEIESVTSGSIEGFEIINPGQDYKVGDNVIFDESTTGGGGLFAEISEIVGNDIIDIENISLAYNSSTFIWNDKNEIKVKTYPYHNLNNLDTIYVSGFSTSLSYLNGFHRIGVSTNASILIKDIPYSSSGIVTDIYVSNIPQNISIGSSIKIEQDIVSILNIFANQNIIRVKSADSLGLHSTSTSIYFIPDTFIINKSVNSFDSKINDLVYFNPENSIGIGTTSGICVEGTYNVGIQTNNKISLQTQAIYLPNHPFKTGQEVNLQIPSVSPSYYLSVTNSPTESSFTIPYSGNNQTIYVIKKSNDHIGIVTQIGLTTSTNGLYFIDNGDNDYEYSIQSNFIQVKGDIQKNKSTVSVSTSHYLNDGDTINLSIKPNLSVGIGTSSSIKVLRDTHTGYLLFNPLLFNSSQVDILKGTINITSHQLKTGDKVKYSANTPILGLSNEFYFVYKVDDNTIKLSETYIDATKMNSPNTIVFGSTGGSIQTISLVNPSINVIKNNDLVFDLSDSSLLNYNFKIFYDQNFSDEFVSTGSTSIFSTIGIGTIGISTNASLKINSNDDLPVSLFYNLERSGYISTCDKEVDNYSKINFINSLYNNSYTISNCGETTFDICLSSSPEKNYYNSSECDELKYRTSSPSAYGQISKIKIISPGSNFKSLPIFKTVESSTGTGAYILPKSESIGKINQIRILNEGFEYSSDKTLRPEALVAKFISIKNSNTITSIIVEDGGKYYISAPNIVLVDSVTKQKIDSGSFTAVMTSSSNSIQSVKIDIAPKGLSESPIIIRTINNTNSIGIATAVSSSSGIVTCYLSTPSSGFSVEPFAIGDKIFVEGIQKEENSGDGFNSEDYGYEFFEVVDYQASTNSSSAILKYSLANLTTNLGTLKGIQNNYGTIVNYNNYPKLNVVQDFTSFIIGETLDVEIQNQFFKYDLKVIDSNTNYIKVFGSYDLKNGQIIRGSQSGTIATINDVKESYGEFAVDYSNLSNIGWYDNIGKLNDDIQVIPDNDYYQNLSYSIKSNQEWEDLISPVNNMLHPSGMKNFSDTQIVQSYNTNSISVNPNQFIDSIVTITESNRVDTINNFDLSVDYQNTLVNTSKFLKFNKKRLADYFSCLTNRVLGIDDISSQFSSSDQDIDTELQVSEILLDRQFNQYLVQISDKNFTQFQFTELIILNNGSEFFTLEKGTIDTKSIIETGYNANSLGEIYGEYDENYSKGYLKFNPIDPYSTSYDIKYLNGSFINSTSGVGTTSIGFIDLIGITSAVSANSSYNVIEKSIDNLKSLHSQIHLIDSVTKKMNYVELFVDHDGTNTNISELYFDSDTGLSSNFIGSFGASISGGILSLTYTNTSNNRVILKSKNIGFGTTSIGQGSYTFKQDGQIEGYENTVRFDSLYSNVSSASSIISLDKTKFSSIKSIVEVSIGQTSALHQIMLVSDGTNAYTSQYPFLSVGTESGIGTFGGEISGSQLLLNFYPDQEFSGNFEILSFNESFYKENDYQNIPSNLLYSNVLETVGVSEYLALNNELNRTRFTLKYQGTPIFLKTFNPFDSTVVNPSTGEFKIKNHFFSTGEELIYRPNSTFSGLLAISVGIGSTLNYAGITTDILPEKVYAIKIDNEKFKIATREEYANSGISVTFTSLGSGNAHEFEMLKKSEKSIITINNVVQEPIAYTLLDYNIDNGNNVDSSTSIFGLSGISSIKIGDILRIDDEYMEIINVGLGTTYSGPITFSGNIPLVSVNRGFVGTYATDHSNSGIASVYKGSFNIVGSDIYFTQAPKGKLLERSFDDLTGLPYSRDYFGGRVFLKKKYDDNKIYDNISTKFTGIGQTYTLSVNGSTDIGLGISESRGIVFINGIFQTPTTENNPNNNFIIEKDNISGISSVIFSGITSSNGSIVISQSDVNLNQLPRGGLIVSLGSDGGLGYAPLVGASVTAIVSGGIITNIDIGTSGDAYAGNWGSGYSSPVSVAVTETGHSGVEASIVATVGYGGTLSFAIVDGGTGYTNPTINISAPSYTNLPITGVSRLGIGSTSDCGIGLLLDINVGASSTTGIGSTLFEVTGFKIKRSGYGFKPGDVIKPVGLVTAYGIPNPVSEFKLTVLDTFTDSFSSWQFGQIDYIDSVKKYQDGTRTRYPLYYNGDLLSFEQDQSNPDSQLIDFNYLLIIFINGILQKPGESYQFTGGTSFTFTEPPKTEDDVAIYFYRGSYEDSSQVTVKETIKIGDDVKLFSSNNSLDSTATQDSRIVYDIVSSDILETNSYTNQGINFDTYRPISWTKQKTDRIVNGYFISKARNSIESQIYPTSKVIKSFDTTDDTIYVDDISLFNYENVPENEVDFDVLIIAESQDTIPAEITATVSNFGIIETLIIENPGSGYVGSSLDISISAPSKIGVGIGTTATASVSIVNGSLSTITITNPGLGYDVDYPPQVLIPSPDPVYENIKNVTGIAGSFGTIVGIATTVGIGTALAINFKLNVSGTITQSGISTGSPIYIFNTRVGNGVTSILSSNSNIVGVGTTFLDNVYIVSGINNTTGIITCNIDSRSYIVGIATTGAVEDNGVGNFSWGKITDFSRSSNPISIGVSGFTANSGLTSFPTIQRRGYGFKNIGAIEKNF